MEEWWEQWRGRIEVGRIGGEREEDRRGEDE